MRKTAFFLCSGLGLGNATRITAILSQLRQLPQCGPDQIDIVVFTWGRALSFLQAESVRLNFRLIELHGYSVPAQNKNPHSLWGSAKYAVRFAKNCIRLWKHVRTERPVIAILDSDFHFIPFLAHRVPIYSLGQAPDIVKRGAGIRFFRMGLRIFLSYWLFEKGDACVKRIFSERVLVPSFEPGEPEGNIVPIPLIVRQEFLQTREPVPSRGKGACIVLSGSGLQSEELARFGRERGIPVFGPEKARTVDSLGADRTSWIEPYSTVITQGGLSSVSECIARGKRLVVVPMKHHAEQWLNGKTVAAYGLGLHLDLEALKTFDMSHLPRVTQSPVPKCSGAELAASLIYQRLGPF